jgi:DUF1707 SHOCT-like domain
MAGPGNEVAAGGQDHGRLRASHADREQVIDVLKAAFVQGRLDQDELDLRAGQALAARTYADLAALTADIPIRPAGARPPEAAWTPLNKRTVAAMTGATAAFVAISRLLAHIPDGSPFALPLLVIFLVLMMTVPTGWLVLLHYWMEKRAARRLQASEMAGGGDADDMKVVKGGDAAERNAVSHQGSGNPAVT